MIWFWKVNHQIFMICHYLISFSNSAFTMLLIVTALLESINNIINKITIVVIH